MRDKITKYVLRTVLDNTDIDNNFGNKSFSTTDLIYIESRKDIPNGPNYENIVYPTDYAVMNNAVLNAEYSKFKDRKSCMSFLRSVYAVNLINLITLDGSQEETVCHDTDLTICPAMQLDAAAVIAAKKTSKSMFNIIKKEGNGKGIYYHTLEFGEFPKTYVGLAFNEELEHNYQLNSIQKTGKKYIGCYVSELPTYNFEYLYRGQKYVRVVSRTRDADSEFLNGDPAPESGDIVWAKVEPITWIIRNWDDLPKELNPNGTGKAKTIKLRTEEGIISGVPFYPNRHNDNNQLWQNSTIRGYLNGIDVNNIKANGNTQYTAPNGGDFSGGGFIEEAFSGVELLQNIEDVSEDAADEIKEYITNKKSRLAQLNPDDTAESDRRQMTDKELIQSWVDAGRSVLLRGPSGIGKTEKLKELYPDLIYLKLTNNMFPEKVVGSMNLQTGQSIPPDFAKQAILACATDEERSLVEKNIQNLYKIADDVYERSKTAEGKVVIMLDELLNVKPAVQSLVYTLVLNKIVENGNGMKLPANTVIVATGNQKKYSSVAEDLAEPLEKRFDHIYDMQPKVGEWIYEYAIPNNIHPSVVSYILNKYMCQDKSEEISDMGYFYEEPEIGEEKLDQYGCKGRTNDPRGWTSISNMLYSFEDNLTKGKYKGKDVEHILDTSLKSKLREEWAADFMDFYNNPTISVEDVVAGNYAEADLPQDINERFAYVSGLIGADEKQLPKVREFIRDYCDPENVEVYDMIWAGDSEYRAEKLAEVKSWQDAEWEIERRKRIEEGQELPF